MKRLVSRAFWGETLMASFTALLAIVTLVWPSWIEVAFHVDPDQYGGGFEWLVVVLGCSATLAFSTLARREWRRARRVGEWK